MIWFLSSGGGAARGGAERRTGGQRIGMGDSGVEGNGAAASTGRRSGRVRGVQWVKRLGQPQPEVMLEPGHPCRDSDGRREF